MPTIFGSRNFSSEVEQKWKAWNLEDMSFESPDELPEQAVPLVSDQDHHDPNQDIPLKQKSVGPGTGLTLVVNTDERSMRCQQYDTEGLRV